MKLYDHQIQMLNFALTHPRSCFLAEMGTGKTKPAILAYYYMKLRGTIKNPCLVVAPTTVLYNWQREIRTLKKDLTSTVLYGSYKQRKTKLSINKDFYIINYDFLHRFRYDLSAKEFGMLIVDELTYVKNYETQRTRAFVILH